MCVLVKGYKEHATSFPRCHERQMKNLLSSQRLTAGPLLYGNDIQCINSV